MAFFEGMIKDDGTAGDSAEGDGVYRLWFRTIDAHATTFTGEIEDMQSGLHQTLLFYRP